MLRGLVTNIQKFSLHDGPGIRTTVFLKGCPLQCAWCHNPENISRRPEVMVVESRCIRCGACVEVCKYQKVVADGSPARVELPLDCEGCTDCVEVCPTGARVLQGREVTPSEVLEEVLADRVFYEESQGGVTFSGGEPLLQFEFLRCLLELSQKQGLHTAVDTCGFAPTDHLLAIAPLTSLFLYDIKFIDEKKHEQFTGVSNQRILDNLQALAKVHGTIWLRVPVIPGVNDADEELEAIAELAAGLPGIRQVTLLGYHKTGVQKFKRLGKEYTLAGLEPPSKERMEAVARFFAAKGLKVKIGG